MDVNILSPYIRWTMYSTLSAGCVIKPRIIYDYELIYVKGGACRINIDGKDYICKENNVVLLRPGIIHSFHCEYGCEFVQPHIHFDMVYNSKSTVTPISFKTREDMTPDELCLIQQDILKDENIPYVFTPCDTAAFQKLFFSVVDAFIENGEEAKLICKAGMLRILSFILEQFKPSTHRLNQSSADPMLLVKDYIDRNYAQMISLDSLASQFYMNKFTMMRRFKELFGENIIGYCNFKKAEKACTLLEETNLSVRSIGELLGYGDAYSFSRFFRKIKGVSPKTYQKKARLDPKDINSSEK